MLYEEKVRRIDSDDEKISEFDKDTLFLKYLSLLVLHQLCVNVLFVAMDCSRPFEDEFKKKMA